MHATCCFYLYSNCSDHISVYLKLVIVVWLSDSFMASQMYAIVIPILTNTSINSKSRSLLYIFTTVKLEIQSISIGYFDRDEIILHTSLSDDITDPPTLRHKPKRTAEWRNILPLSLVMTLKYLAIVII